MRSAWGVRRTDGRRQVELTEEARDELTRIAEQSQSVSRQRAVAILKVANVAVAAQTPPSGLLIPRGPDTVYRWLDRYAEHRVAGLTIAPGRGRKPTLSPLTSDERAEERPPGLLELLASDPREHGQPQTPLDA